MKLSDQERVATGATAEVFTWGEKHVLKLYREGYPPDEAEQEARRARLAAESGIRTPAVFEVLLVEGRQGIVFERVEGPTLLQTLMAHPDRWESLAGEMANLHAVLHGCPAYGLPSQRGRLERGIRRATALSDSTRATALATLNRLPKETSLCHGDFHPNNILLTDGGPVVIDWVDTTEGHPVADVTRTWLLIMTGSVSNSLPEERRRQTVLLRRQFVEAYLYRYRQSRPCSVEDLVHWLPVVAAARLSERIRNPEEIEALLNLANGKVTESVFRSA